MNIFKTFFILISNWFILLIPGLGFIALTLYSAEAAESDQDIFDMFKGKKTIIYGL